MSNQDPIKRKNQVHSTSRKWEKAGKKCTCKARRQLGKKLTKD